MEKLILNNYGSFDLTFVKGKNATMWDANGKKYIDFHKFLINFLRFPVCFPQGIRPSFREEGVIRDVSAFSSFLEEQKLAPEKRRQSDDQEIKWPQKEGLQSVTVLMSGHAFVGGRCFAAGGLLG